MSFDKNSEVRIVFIGIQQKCFFFDKLKGAAIKTERHVNYQDTFYLTYKIDENEIVVELVDPGLEHTGAREMSIRKAHGALLFYSACWPDSFERLKGLVNDFQNCKNIAKLPIVLIGCEDEGLSECGETSSTDQSSISEGYESETPHAHCSESNWRKRPNMEKIREDIEQGMVTRQEGERFAMSLGSGCKFLPIEKMSEYTDTPELIETMLRNIHKQQHQKHRLQIRYISAKKAEKSEKGVKSENSPKNEKNEKKEKNEKDENNEKRENKLLSKTTKEKIVVSSVCAIS